VVSAFGCLSGALRATTALKPQGFFGIHYAGAAYVALNGYQQQLPDQTLYPGYGSLGYTTVFNLQEGQAILVSFSGKPVLQRGGFWSISAYGEDQNLIPNPLFRFKVGSQNSSLVYRDGSRIYNGTSSTSSRNGPFDVLIQPQTPPSNWTTNWLPASNRFYWLVRWYTAEPAMTNGSYQYPVVQTISAITGSASATASASSARSASRSASISGPTSSASSTVS